MNNNLSKWPYFSADEISVVSKVLESGKVNYWTGEECKLFEKEYAAYLKVPYSIALANGTVALELALYALGIGPGDDVIVPARTFIATASCAIARGARPVVADVDLNSHNITADTIAAAITPKTKAIIVVHLGGLPCDMDPILALAKKHDLKVIEDCAQAHGAFYKGKPIGSFGDASAFSFCQDKIISTGGEGGLLVLRDVDAWKKACSYKDHGKNYDLISQSTSNQLFKWVHDSFGTNFRMTELQAALGRIQLKRLAQSVETRRRNASILNEHFSKTSLFKPITLYEEYYHSYYRYYVSINANLLTNNWTRDKIIHALHEHGVQCGIGSCSEIYLEKAFINSGLSPKQRLPNAKLIGETTIAFLVHPTLTEDHMNTICNSIQRATNIVYEKTS